jgi:hypothetical protein
LILSVLVFILFISLQRGKIEFDDINSSIGLTSLRSNRAAGEESTKDEFDCNPFMERGRLLVDKERPSNNVWKPYDTNCQPSTYMASLYTAPKDTSPLIPILSTNANDNSLPIARARAGEPVGRAFLPWVMNRTIIIHGDSIDRFHLKDFCDLVKGRLFLIDSHHPSSPAPYRQTTDPDPSAEGEARRAKRVKYEEIWEGRPTSGQQLTSPWVCDIEPYGTTLISVFTFGLPGGEGFFGSEGWYYPPAQWIERLDFITLPLLSHLAEYLGRPAIVRPDLIEINSGLWDLRRMTEGSLFHSRFCFICAS